MDTAAESTGPSVDMAAFRFVEEMSRDMNRGNIDLPSFPDIAMKVKKVLADENSTLDQIARIVGAEPGLAARVLKMANSAACNRGGENVRDIKRAIGRLGHESLRTLAISYAMQNMMEGRNVAVLKPYLQQLWVHSVRVAAIAHALGASLPTVDADEALFAGLIHDIGKLYILTKIEEHPDLFDTPEGIETILADWHAPIGRSILETWGFDETLMEAVGMHEETDRRDYGDPTLADVLIAANVLGVALEQRTLDDVDFDSMMPCTRVGVTNETWKEVLDNSKEEIAQMTAVLNG